MLPATSALSWTDSAVQRNMVGVDALPTGTVTFLFSDIEGSTKLLEEHGSGYVALLAEHRRVLRDAFMRHGGVEVDTQGDAFFVAFERATDAVAAARDAQRALEVPVRIGIHTGEPQLMDGGYVGIDVHRAARICAAAHGRQVVLSEPVAAALNGQRLRDLGLHRLKDLVGPVRLFQLGEGSFPPLRSLNATNLPSQTSSLVGRERDLEELQPLVRSSRIVTLTGPGGSGKTRLGLQVAAELVETFKDGVFWVALAAVRDPQLVLPTVQQALGAKVPLVEHVDEKRMLLLLDNLEQVVDCAAELSELLERCPNLHLLCTSRALLRIAGESEYVVEPLPESDAVTLFRERAANSEPLAAVHEICRRLDGLPLAVELAAARTRLLPPDQLLDRLERSLPVLTGGRRDAPERQRTLRATIEWSHELLDPDEQQLFRRLAVFAGSFTVEAAEAVCDCDLEALESLLEQSLIRRWASGRLGMLETIREYAGERLGESGEAADMRRRHAQFFLELARSANLSMEAMYAGRPERHDLVREEQANLRAALDAALDNDPELGLELAVALEQFWVMQSPIEAMRRLEALIARASSAPLLLLGRAYRVLGGTCMFAGEDERAHAVTERALTLFREADDDVGETTMLFRMGTSYVVGGDHPRARELLAESLVRFRRLGIPMGECEALGNLGSIGLLEGDGDALELVYASIQIAREIGWKWWEGSKEGDVAEHFLKNDDPASATGHLHRALVLYDEIDDRIGRVYTLALAAWLAAARGDARRAGRIWGAIEREERRAPLGAWEQTWRTTFAERLEPFEGPAFEEGRAVGAGFELEQAVADALSHA